MFPGTEGHEGGTENNKIVLREAIQESRERYVFQLSTQINPLGGAGT